jgi:hypothetical protein
MAKKDEGFLLDSDGNPVQSLGGYARTSSYDDEKVTQNRMEAARKQLAQDVQDKLKADKAKGDAERLSYDAEQGAKAPAAAAKKAPAKKAPIVTKEQLAKSGFTNLRDYLNDKKGLKRRDGKAPEKKAPEQKTPESQKPATPINRARPTPEGSKPQQYGSPSYMRNEKRIEMEKARKEIQPQRREEQKISQRRKNLADSVANVSNAFSAVPGGIGGVSNLVKRTRADKDAYTRPAEASMKKGGTVRGAGIARQGVRKCKMV